jgi:hypothetical protein
MVLVLLSRVKTDFQELITKQGVEIGEDSSLASRQTRSGKMFLTRLVSDAAAITGLQIFSFSLLCSFQMRRESCHENTFNPFNALNSSAFSQLIFQ